MVIYGLYLQYPTVSYQQNFNLLRLSFEVRRLAGDRSKRGVGSSQKLPGDASGLRSSPKLSKMLSWRKGDDLEINGNNKQDANTIKIIKYHNYKIMKESKRRLKSQNTLCKTRWSSAIFNNVVQIICGTIKQTKAKDSYASYDWSEAHRLQTLQALLVPAGLDKCAAKQRVRPDGLRAYEAYDKRALWSHGNSMQQLRIPRGFHSSLYADPQKRPEIPMFLPSYPHKLLKRLHLGLSKDEGTSNYIWCQLRMVLCSNAKLYSCILGLASLSWYLPPTVCRCWRSIALILRFQFKTHLETKRCVCACVCLYKYIRIEWNDVKQSSNYSVMEHQHDWNILKQLTVTNKAS